MQQGDVNALVRGGLMVIARWTAKQGEADKVADIIARYLPKARAEPGVKIFLIGRSEDDPAQFLFTELFVDDAAFAAHQQTEHFKALILGEALPLLASRERTRYAVM